MAQVSTDFCRQLARARRGRGMTQSALAQAVGCKQSAISMLESGQPEKLARETVAKIAGLLGVSMAEETPTPTSGLSFAGVSGYCPNAHCFSNVPYTVQGELLFWPRLQTLAAGLHCAFCGELLETRCPACGAPVTEGACCPACGQPRVTNTLPPETPPDVWASQRRNELTEWKRLSSS